MEIVRGTTPTIRYTFSSVSVSNITVAKLLIEQGDIKIEKGLSDATTGQGYLEWTLSQTDTLSLQDKKACRIRLDWKLQDGTRGIGKTVSSVDVRSSAYNEVI